MGEGTYATRDVICEEHPSRPREYSGTGCGINLQHGSALSSHKIEKVQAVALQLSVNCREGERAGET